MAFISNNSKLLLWRPTLHPIFPSTSLSSRLSTSTSIAEPLSEPDHLHSPPDPPPQPQQQQQQPQSQTIQSKSSQSNNPELIISRMLANRDWTTRLQNSIRSIAPKFDSNLVYNILHATTTNPDQALKFYRWLERSNLFIHDTNTTLKMIQILTRYSKLNHARCILLDLPKKNLPYDEDMFVALIEGYGRAGIVQEAVKIFQKFDKKTVKSYDALFKVILRRGRYMMAKRVYNAMLREGCVDAGRVDRAVEVFEEMKNNGIKPNAVTYTTLLPGLCDADKLVEAGNVLGEMVERYIAPNDNSVFMKLMNCHCKVGNLDDAVNVLKAMIRLSIPTEAGHYGVLIENFCKANVYDRAEKLLDKLVEKDIILRPENSFEMGPSAYNPMIEYLCDNGRTVKAETFFRQLMKKGVLDSVAFNNLIRGHLKEGNPESALEIATIMSRRGVSSDSDSYRLLTESYLRKGEPADAKIALDHMIESGHQPDSSLYRSVMESLFEDGRVQTASRVMKSMVEKGVMENMDLVSKILEALLMRGHVEEALGRIDLLMQNGCEPDFDHLLSILCEKEKRIAALRLLDFVLEKDIIIDFSNYDKVLDTLLAAGKTLNAYSVLCKILAKGGATDWSSRDLLIKSLNQEGNTKQADILSRMIKEKVASSPKKEGKKKASRAT
ncbi:hypothetical protein TSUD_102640 [Trifolium subterraneum]|uniref:Pentacotripeptide-repeat region of PRORP domain-containing protein n=1 Tax=Trifolium subterraneum TaxID=3900 RepID=A0A2Z6MYT0_TRISU|nr:hypothetical protein TSUD_102640 [Trifolium subterraneum]